MNLKQSIDRLIVIAAAVAFPGLAAGADYHVGPGQTHDDINDIAMHLLTAGDTVYIHWRPTPYREKFRLSGVGTAAQPIQVNGVPGPNGERPVIDGENATSHPGDLWPIYGNNESTGDYGIIIVYRGPGRPYQEKPSHIRIEGLEITHARNLYTFSDANGNPRTWGGSGIWILGAENLTIVDCKIHDCSDGLFAKSLNDEPNVTRNLVVRRCHIENCSENLQASGHQFASHNVYTECEGVLFEENYFGPTRPNADGGNLKDRSSGTVIRYNWIEGGLRLLDLVEAQDLFPFLQQKMNNGDLSYRTTQVYGNYLYSGPGHAVRAVHYGGDSGDISTYRKGNLYFHHNTIVYHRDQAETWRVSAFQLSTDDETAHIWNNVIYREPATQGATPALLYLVNRYGHHHFGPNWVTAGHGTWDNGLPPAAAGTLNGLGNLLSGSDPGFQDVVSKDLRPRVDSPLRDMGGPLPANAFPVIDQYVRHRTSELRPATGIADLGAHEFDPSPGSIDPPSTVFPTMRDRLKRKIGKLRKQLRKARRKNDRREVKSLARKLRKLRGRPRHP